MTLVLVTGATGTLGRPLVATLAGRGHDVRALTRSPSGRELPGGTVVGGDVRSGAGLDEAFDGVDVVVHAASDPVRHVLETEVEGTRHVLEAARSVGAHTIYVSIVGVDRHSFSYYRAKRAAELLIEGGGVAPAGSWTIQRITQFHDLIERFLSTRPVPMPKSLPFQPVEVTEAAARLADLVDQVTPGFAVDMGGPERLTLGEMAEVRRQVRGKRARFVPVPLVGPYRDFSEGLHLPGPGAILGTGTWADFQRRKA